MAEEKRHEEQEFSFVKEKIKKQPFYQNKNLRRAGIRLLFSVLCGLAACLAFVLARPWMEQTFGKKEMTEITIPAEEEEQQDTEEDEEPEEEEAEEETAPQDPVVITQPQELEAEDYATLYARLKEVADAAAQSLAAVTVSSSDTDWFNETYENRRQVSGLLVGNNGVEILILVPYSQVTEADRLQASLADGSTLEAVLKNYDRVTDLAILSVNLADVGEETLESIRIAELGSSRGLKAGDPVIAVGSPAGIAGSVKYGNLVAAGYQTGVTDGSYGLLITDMERSEEGSGVLLNLSGQVVGLIEDVYLHSANEMEAERARLRERIRKTEKPLAEPKDRKPKKALKPSDLHLGDTVRVLSLNLEGTVSSLPDARGNLFVQMGILRSQVKLSDLELVEEAVITSKQFQKTSAGKIKMGKSASVSTEINLIGMTVDEALAHLDKYLDDAYLAHLPSVRIVHGKGTGALRKAVQGMLKRNKYVKSYRLGEFGEGDAGVTIATLKQD